jgi:hypothetical protein
MDDGSTMSKSWTPRTGELKLKSGVIQASPVLTFKIGTSAFVTCGITFEPQLTRRRTLFAVLTVSNILSLSLGYAVTFERGNVHCCYIRGRQDASHSHCEMKNLVPGFPAKKSKSESKPHGETLRNASTKQDTARKREAHQGIDRECLRPLNWPNHNGWEGG